MRRIAISLVALVPAGCAYHSSWIEPDVAARMTADAAAQVRRCYRTPRVMGEAKRISTRLHVRYGPDGHVAGVPMVVEQTGVTPGNRLFADAMAQAAIASVMRCSPLRLSPELYATGGSDFELTFSPALRG